MASENIFFSVYAYVSFFEDLLSFLIDIQTPFLHEVSSYKFGMVYLDSNKYFGEIFRVY